MADTVRTKAAILALLADNTTGDISPQDMRDFVVSIYGTTDTIAANLVTTNSAASTLAGRVTTVEGRATALESRATALESRATAIEAAATTLAARVTSLEAGFPGTSLAKWGLFQYRWPDAAGATSITDYGMSALTTATGLPPKILHWYCQAGGWDGSTNFSGYNWTGPGPQVAYCLANNITPMITWEFFGTFEANPVRRQAGVQDFPLLAFTTVPQLGTANAAVSTTNTTLTDTRAAWTTNQWAGQIVKCNGKAMLVTSNTATAMTGASWTGGSNPGNAAAWTIRPIGLTTQANPLVPVATISGSEHETLQAYIDTWAAGVAALITVSGSAPVYLRIFHEMNLAYNSGIGYPWGVYDVYNDGLYKATGNTPARLVAAWKYVVDRFTAAGATNVRWVWNSGGDLGPNPITPGCYPGDTYVDFIGADIYNTSPAGTVPTDYAILAATTLGGTSTSGTKRMIFGEVGVAASSDGGTTAPLTYINTDLTNLITSGAARIEALVWWNQWNYALSSDNPTGSGVTTANTTLTDSSAGMGTNEFVGATVTCNGKTGTVTSNTATVLTMSGGWSGGGNPGNAHAYTCIMTALCSAISPMMT